MTPEPRSQWNAAQEAELTGVAETPEAADAELAAWTLQEFAAAPLDARLRLSRDGWCAACGYKAGRTVERYCARCGASPWSPGVPRPIGFGIDTLHLFWKVPLAGAELARLKLLQLEAKGKAEKDWPLVAIGGQELTVRPGGAEGATLLLIGRYMAVKLNPKPARNLPTVMIELRSEWLWQRGPDQAVVDAQLVVEDLVPDSLLVLPKVLEPNVTRCDLALDFQGFVPTFTEMMPATWLGLDKNAPGLKCLADDITPHLKNRHNYLDGIDYGSKGSEISAGLYNKTEEIRVASQKEWFRTVWMDDEAFVPDEPVWRLEFRLRREGITGFLNLHDKRPVQTWREFKDALPRIWQYLTKKWLVRRGQRTKKTRAVVDQSWQIFVDHDTELLHQGTAEVLRYRMLAIEERFTPQIAGYAARELGFMRTATNNKRLTLEAIWWMLFERVVHHFDGNETTAEIQAANLCAQWNAEAEWRGIQPALIELTDVDDFHRNLDPDWGRRAAGAAYKTRAKSPEEWIRKVRRLQANMKPTEREVEVVERMSTGEVWARRKQGFT